jgi:hypothetical protein
MMPADLSDSLTIIKPETDDLFKLKEIAESLQMLTSYMDPTLLSTIFTDLIDNQIKVKISADRLHIEKPCLLQIKAWFQHTVLRFITYFNKSLVETTFSQESFAKIEAKFADV